MIIMLVSGAGIGAGLLALLRAFIPSRPSLAAALAALTAPTLPPMATRPADAGRWAARLGRPGSRLLGELGLPHSRVQADLAVLGRPVEVYLAEQVTTILAGFLLPAAVAGVAALAGTGLPIGVPAVACLLLAAAGVLAVDAGVHLEAAKRRRDFTHALSGWCDLVVISLAAGVGIEQSVMAAASIGRGWAAETIRTAVTTARLTHTSPWTALGRLGQELGVRELQELAASLALAGTEGARVRASLATKATALRGHLLANAETEAVAATERMSLPLVLLFAAFLLLIGYPAVSHVIYNL